jgi:putative acetyltransferase
MSPLRTFSIAWQCRSMLIREERPGDQDAIRQLVKEAFALATHSSGTEAEIIDRLRSDTSLSVSLVAEESDEIVGQCAAPVRISGASGFWFGLGPVAVAPTWQGRGIGGALIDAALCRLRARGAAGCVVLGDPAYYCRFGFRHDASLSYADVPPPYFQVLSYGDERPRGSVEYHRAFS